MKTRTGYVIKNGVVIGKISTTEKAAMHQFGYNYSIRNEEFKGYINRFYATLSFSKKNAKEYEKLVESDTIFHYNYQRNVLEF